MSGVGGVWLERAGAGLLVVVSTVGTWWLSTQSAEVAQRTSQREERLEHLATLVSPRATVGQTAPPLDPFDDLFRGQRLCWADSARGRVLTLRAAATEEGQ